ncbi:MAG: hypothetical protein JNL28_13845 [Planctomycetes bacterium]|nr:hypothetical protein [Planctomycetota bacterium]
MRTPARELVRDEQRAADLVQETLVAALRRAPSDAVNLRGWLATAVRTWRAYGTRPGRRGG